MKDMKKWYKRIIGKTGLDLLLNRITFEIKKN